MSSSTSTHPRPSLKGSPSISTSNVPNQGVHKDSMEEEWEWSYVPDSLAPEPDLEESQRILQDEEPRSKLTPKREIPEEFRGLVVPDSEEAVDEEEEEEDDATSAYKSPYLGPPWDVYGPRTYDSQKAADDEIEHYLPIWKGLRST